MSENPEELVEEYLAYRDEKRGIPLDGPLAMIDEKEGKRLRKYLISAINDSVKKLEEKGYTRVEAIRELRKIVPPSDFHKWFAERIYTTKKEDTWTNPEKIWKKGKLKSTLGTE